MLFEFDFLALEILLIRIETTERRKQLLIRTNRHLYYKERYVPGIEPEAKLRGTETNLQATPTLGNRDTRA